MKKKITLNYYDGSEESEYEIYEDGEVSIYVVSNEAPFSNEKFL